MQLDHRPAQGKTQSVALDSAAIRGRRAIEALEDALAIRVGNTGTVVANGKHCFALTSLETHVHAAAFLTAVLARVGDQVQERATEHLGIHYAADRFRWELEAQCLALAMRDRLHRARRALRHLAQIARGRA